MKQSVARFMMQAEESTKYEVHITKELKVY